MRLVFAIAVAACLGWLAWCLAETGEFPVARHWADEAVRIAKASTRLDRLIQVTYPLAAAHGEVDLLRRPGNPLERLDDERLELGPHSLERGRRRVDQAVPVGIGGDDVSLQVTASGDVIEPRIEDSSRGRLFNKSSILLQKRLRA